MSGGSPAANRVRMSGMKLRADVYLTSMPEFAVNCFATLRNASCSLPPQSERTSTEPALRFVGFAPICDAVRPPASSATKTASAKRDFRRFTSNLLLLVDPSFPRRCYIAPSFSFRRGQAQLRLRVEDMQFVDVDRKLDFVACRHLLVRWYERNDLVSLGLPVDQLFVAEVLDDVDAGRNAHRL